MLPSQLQRLQVLGEDSTAANVTAGPFHSCSGGAVYAVDAPLKCALRRELMQLVLSLLAAEQLVACRALPGLLQPSAVCRPVPPLAGRCRRPTAAARAAPRPVLW